MKKILITTLVSDPRLLVRERTDEDVVLRYRAMVAESLEAWPFPPISIAVLDGKNVVIDGWHRLAVAKTQGMKEIDHVVVATTLAAAQLAAASANGKHGQPLTKAERKTAAMMALMGDPTASDRSVAWMVGLSPSTVASVRGEAEDMGFIPDASVRTGADGKKYLSPVKTGDKNVDRQYKAWEKTLVETRDDWPTKEKKETESQPQQVSKLDTCQDVEDEKHVVDPDTFADLDIVENDGANDGVDHYAAAMALREKDEAIARFVTLWRSKPWRVKSLEQMVDTLDSSHLDRLEKYIAAKKQCD